MKNKEYYHTNILRKYVRKLEVQEELITDVRLITTNLDLLERNKLLILDIFRSSTSHSEKWLKKAILRTINRMVPKKETAYGISRYLYFAALYTNAWLVNLPVDDKTREFLMNIRKRFRAWSMGSLYYSGFGFHSNYIGAQFGLKEILPYKIT